MILHNWFIELNDSQLPTNYLVERDDDDVELPLSSNPGVRVRNKVKQLIDSLSPAST